MPLWNQSDSLDPMDGLVKYIDSKVDMGLVDYWKINVSTYMGRSKHYYPPYLSQPSCNHPKTVHAVWHCVAPTDEPYTDMLEIHDATFFQCAPKTLTQVMLPEIHRQTSREGITAHVAAYLYVPWQSYVINLFTVIDPPQPPPTPTYPINGGEHMCTDRIRIFIGSSRGQYGFYHLLPPDNGTIQVAVTLHQQLEYGVMGKEWFPPGVVFDFEPLAYGADPALQGR